jgi:transcriptional regulator with XRE-family HTH domain
MRKVNRRIAELRTRKGFTQEKLAEKMNVEVRTVRRWEAGANISLWTLYRFREVLDQRVSDFFQEPLKQKTKRKMRRKQI